jgi:hypothetical protein
MAVRALSVRKGGLSICMGAPSVSMGAVLAVNVPDIHNLICVISTYKLSRSRWWKSNH